LVVIAAAFLAACSGGGTSSSSKPTPNATIRGAVRLQAGGAQVGGVTFRTAGATLRMPDDSASPVILETEDAIRSHLDDGMVVTVRGAIDDNGGTGEAVEIEFHDLMEATIDDKGAGRIRLLGEDLSIDDSTEIVDRHGGKLTPDDLSNGTRVEVSGFPDDKGGLRASFVRVRDDVAPGMDHEVKGWVIAISGTVLDLSFSKGGALALRADVSGIASPPAVAVGDFVEVSFPETNPDSNGDGILEAVALHLEEGLEAEPNDEAEVEGIVTSVDAGGFAIGGQPVVLEPDAVLTGGTIDDLVPGVKVEAEGFMGDGGVLHAHQVKFQASARIDANLTGKDEANGTLSLLGLVIHVTPSTDLRSFGALADLAVGDRIEVRGYPTKDGLGLNATRIELVDPAPNSNDRAFLRAVVSAKTPTSALTMLGIAVDTSAASYKDPADGPMAAADFFAAITEGRTIVKVRWRPYPASTAEPIDEAELEN
jgi:hypothetical protein